MSHSEVEISGDLPKIIGNEENLYEGNLIYYFPGAFLQSKQSVQPLPQFSAHVACAVALLQGLPVLLTRVAAASNARAADCCIIPRL